MDLGILSKSGKDLTVKNTPEDDKLPAWYIRPHMYILVEKERACVLKNSNSNRCSRESD